MTIRVDNWTTGVRGDIVQLPFAQALQEDARLEQRLVYCKNSPRAADLDALDIPSFSTLGTRDIRSLPRMFAGLSANRTALKHWYANERRLVHVAMWSPWDHFYIDIPKRAGSKILLTVHDAQKHIGEENWLLTALENDIIHKADHIAVLSEYAKDVFRSRLSVHQKVDVISPGLVMNTAPPSPPRSWPKDRPLRFLFFGRIHAYKGLDILLDAWALLKSGGGPPMTLTIAGSGNIAPYQAAIDKGKDIVLRHGWMSDADMDQIFAEHDVNVMAYRETSASATALAGLWAGLPSVVTPIDGLKDYFVHGQNALVSGEVSYEAVAARIAEIARSPQWYEQLSKGACAMANCHSARSVANNWYSLYDKVWNEQGLA